LAAREQVGQRPESIPKQKRPRDFLQFYQRPFVRQGVNLRLAIGRTAANVPQHVSAMQDAAKQLKLRIGVYKCAQGVTQ
jgi:hypothetical protein